MTKEIVLSEKTIQEWQADARRIDKQIEHLKSDRESIFQKINAGKVILGQNSLGRQENLNFSRAMPFRVNLDWTLGRIILGALHNLHQPLTQTFLIKELFRLGVPEKKLGVRRAYFYTSVLRLKEAGDIIKSTDGRISITDKGKKKVKG